MLLKYFLYSRAGVGSLFRKRAEFYFHTLAVGQNFGKCQPEMSKNNPFWLKIGIFNRIERCRRTAFKSPRGPHFPHPFSRACFGRSLLINP